MKLTDASVKALRPANKRYEVFETEGKGFGVRVTPSGLRTFIFRYRYVGRQRRMTLGQYGKGGISLKDAREKLYDALKKLGKGIDPGAEALQQKRKEIEAGTVAELVQEYIEKHAKRNKRTWRDDQRMLNKDVLPKWRNRKVKDIKRRDVADLVDDIAERAPVTANRTFEIVRKMFKFAIERDYIEASPCYGISKPTTERRRDRVLSPDEIKTFWDKVEAIDATDPVKAALKLLLVTAQRRGELTSAEWDNIDLYNGWWTIPADTTKNKLAHRVPLPETAVSLFRKLKDLSKDSAYVLPSPRGGGKQPMRNGALTRAVGRNSDKFSIDFVLHDLRRTAASQMASIGVPRLVIGRVLNHAENGVTAVYDRHSYDTEKRQALDAWDVKLRELTHGHP